jgi:hypothetical protein
VFWRVWRRPDPAGSVPQQKYPTKARLEHGKHTAGSRGPCRTTSQYGLTASPSYCKTAPPRRPPESLSFRLDGKSGWYLTAAAMWPAPRTRIPEHSSNLQMELQSNVEIHPDPPLFDGRFEGLKNAPGPRSWGPTTWRTPLNTLRVSGKIVARPELPSASFQCGPSTQGARAYNAPGRTDGPTEGAVRATSRRAGAWRHGRELQNFDPAY